MKKSKADTNGPAAYLLLPDLPPPDTQAPWDVPLYSSLDPRTKKVILVSTFLLSLDGK